MQSAGTTQFKGKLAVKKSRSVPKAPLEWRVRNALRWAFVWGWLSTKLAHAVARVTGMPVLTATLHVLLTKADGSKVNYGIVSYRVVTTAFVNFLVDQFQTDTTEIGDFKFHDSGVGSTAEAIANTAMETTDGEARVSGTQTEGAANVYVSVGTITYTTTKAITEHGLFSHLTAGTLMDRSVFSAVNVVNTEQITFTYSLTVAAGG